MSDSDIVIEMSENEGMAWGMALLGHVQWDKFLSPDSKCPPDVFFICKGEDGQIVKIGAHRLLLAGVSEVFENTFFGPMKNSEEEVEVKDTSPEAFQLLINFIYGDTYNDEVNGIIDRITSPKLLVELFALEDFYGLQETLELKTTLMRKLKSNHYKPFVTRENYIESALVARNYKEIFPEMARELQMKSLQVHLATKDKDFPEDLLRELMDVAKTVLQLSGNQKPFFNREDTFFNAFLQTGAILPTSTVPSLTGSPVPSQSSPASGRFLSNEGRSTDL